MGKIGGGVLFVVLAVCIAFGYPAPPKYTPPELDTSTLEDFIRSSAPPSAPFTHSIEVTALDPGEYCLDVEGSIDGPACRYFGTLEVGTLEVRSTVGEEADWNAWGPGGLWAAGITETVHVAGERRRGVRRP